MVVVLAHTISSTSELSLSLSVCMCAKGLCLAFHRPAISSPRRHGWLLTPWGRRSTWPTWSFCANKASTMCTLPCPSWTTRRSSTSKRFSATNFPCSPTRTVTTRFVIARPLFSPRWECSHFGPHQGVLEVSWTLSLRLIGCYETCQWHRGQLWSLRHVARSQFFVVIPDGVMLDDASIMGVPLCVYVRGGVYLYCQSHPWWWLMCAQQLVCEAAASSLWTAAILSISNLCVIVDVLLITICVLFSVWSLIAFCLLVISDYNRLCTGGASPLPNWIVIETIFLCDWIPW